jgi:hypothetical protein
LYIDLHTYGSHPYATVHLDGPVAEREILDHQRGDPLVRDHLRVRTPDK